jgi:hypothetical protein
MNAIKFWLGEWRGALGMATAYFTMSRLPRDPSPIGQH